MKLRESLAAVAAMYGKTVSPFEIGVWEKSLDRFDETSIQRAFQTHISDVDCGVFMPKVADIIRHLEGDTKDKAYLAWSKAFNAIQTVGQYYDVCFDDGVIHAVIEEMGGWVKFCMMETDEISYITHRFKELYITNAKHTKAYPKMVTGISSQQNRLTGKPVEKPVPVGDLDQCRLVYKNGGGYRTNNGGNLLSDITKKITDNAKAFDEVQA